jgi:hypothetical protein
MADLKPIDQAYADRGLCRFGAVMDHLRIDREALAHLIAQQQLTPVEFGWKKGKQRGIPLDQLAGASVVYRGGHVCLVRQHP